MNIHTQQINSDIFKSKKINLFIKRIDLIHPFVSGNKYYKLKHNFTELHKQKKDKILTFGGAYSNHICATSYYAKKNNIKSIGIIRGDKHVKLNHTLTFATKQGMELHYVSREDYRQKHKLYFINQLKNKFGDFYLLPEGGSNILAVKGSREIINNDNCNYICCSVGTGATISGIMESSKKHQKVVGFPALKSYKDLQNNIKKWSRRSNIKLEYAYVGNGYAKISNDLIKFINNFYYNYNIPLDAIYNGKMMMGIFDLASKNYFEKGSNILAVHTGGVQANKGFNDRFGIDLPLI
tara:strand:- start:2959 stop:3843 length:885 start_codon:yes stop_codon:yes gene_type:complete